MSNNYELGKETYKVITGDMVNVSITSNITSFTSEKRFDKSITVTELRSKLELICGASAGAMTIEVFDKDDKKICTLQVSGHRRWFCVGVRTAVVYISPFQKRRFCANSKCTMVFLTN